MIILMGPIGSGKSVQAEILVKNRQFSWISAGNLLRASEDQEIKEILAQGKLVPDETIMKMIDQSISAVSGQQNIVLDGFPRRTSQADWLSQATKRHNREIEAVIHIILAPEVAYQRMKLRGRDDDSLEAITERNQVYEEQVTPLVDYYKKQNLLYDVDGSKTIAEVGQLIAEVLDKVGV